MVGGDSSPGDRIAYFEAESDQPALPAETQPTPLPAGDATIPFLLMETPEFVAVVPSWTSPKNGILPASCSQETYQRLRDGSIGYQLAGTFKSPALRSRQRLDYPSVNPIVHIFKRIAWDLPTQLASED